MAKKTLTKKDQSPLPEQSSLVLKNPRITEKAANASKVDTYVFDVMVGATRSEIKKAFEKRYKSKPTRVNTLDQIAPSYFKKGVLGFGKRTKKAYITVAKGTKIDIA